MLDEEFMDKVTVFQDAVQKNMKTNKLKPKGNQVHVQVMPKPRREGAILKPYKNEILGTKDNGYGTVINVGPDVSDIEPGDDVMFPRKLGRKFGGMYNPLNVSTGCDWKDEIRVLGNRNIIGVMDYDLEGKEVNASVRGGGVENVLVLIESVLFGGAIYVEFVESGDKGWIPRTSIT